MTTLAIAVEYVMAIQSPTSDLISIERSQIEALLDRIVALETKVGIPVAAATFSSSAELPTDIVSNVVSVTERLFNGYASIEPKSGDIGEDDYFLVKVQVDQDADPRDIATKTSVWHDRMSELNVPAKHSLRLKVAYK